MSTLLVVQEPITAVSSALAWTSPSPSPHLADMMQGKTLDSPQQMVMCLLDRPIDDTGENQQVGVSASIAGWHG